MRRISFTMLLALIALTVSAVAQVKTEETVTTTDSTGKVTTTTVTRVGTSEDITVRTNMIVVNPLKFFFFYNLSYFHAVSKNVVVGGGFQTPAAIPADGFGVSLEMRYHPSGKAMRGFYVAPNISFNSLTSEWYNDNSATPVFTIGALLGWQWFPGDEFAMGLGIGFDHYFSSGEDDGEFRVFDSVGGTEPALRFDIGYAW